MKTVTIRRTDDETIVIEVDGAETAWANHDEHGWAGMNAVILAVREVAAALGAKVDDQT